MIMQYCIRLIYTGPEDYVAQYFWWHRTKRGQEAYLCDVGLDTATITTYTDLNVPYQKINTRSEYLYGIPKTQVSCEIEEYHGQTILRKVSI